MQRHHEESEDDEDDWTEDEDVSTPLDPIDPFVAFADTLATLRQHLPARFEVRFDVGREQRAGRLCQWPGLMLTHCLAAVALAAPLQA